MRLLRNYAFYILGFLPIHFLAAYLEIATWESLTSAFAGWAVFILPSLLVMGLTAVPLSQAAVDALTPASAVRTLPYRVLLTAGAFLVNVIVLALIGWPLEAGLDSWFLLLAHAPAAALLSTVAYGCVIRAGPSYTGRAVQRAHFLRIGAVYGVLAAAVFVYAFALPTAFPSASYAFSDSLIKNRIAAKTLRQVTPGWPAQQLDDALPGFVPRDALEGKAVQASGLLGGGFHYSIVYDSGFVSHIEVRGEL